LVIFNPDKLFALEGKSGIGGHIDRIRRHANQYYANDYFPIVPVMLLAAQLSSEPKHQENNVAKCVGPALAVAGVALEVLDMIKQREIEQKMADARRDITSQFQAIGKDLESQLAMQLDEFNNQFYGDIEQQIAAARQQQENAIALSNNWMKELIAIRQGFTEILKHISQKIIN
jgi:hypothetical protein